MTQKDEMLHFPSRPRFLLVTVSRNSVSDLSPGGEFFSVHATVLGARHQANLFKARLARAEYQHVHCFIPPDYYVLACAVYLSYVSWRPRREQWEGSTTLDSLRRRRQFVCEYLYVYIENTLSHSTSTMPNQISATTHTIILVTAATTLPQQLRRNDSITSVGEFCPCVPISYVHRQARTRFGA